MDQQRDELRMDPKEAKARLDAGRAMVLDVVASHVWPAMHRAIAGAVRIPPEEIEDRLNELPRDRDILAYCT